MVQPKTLSPSQVRAIWMGTFALAGLYIWAAEAFGKSGSLTLQDWGIVALAVWSAWGGSSVRRKLERKAADETRNGGDGLGKWSSAQLAAMFAAQAVILWGVIARMIVGCPTWFAVAFYAAGVLLLFAWKPIIPPRA